MAFLLNLIPLSVWRALIVRALATTPATYDPAKLDEVIRGS